MALGGGDRRLLFQALLKRLLMEQMAQQQQQQPPQAKGPSGLQDVINKVKQAKNTYNTGKDIYNLGSSAYDAISGTQALSPATQAAWNQAGGEASQAAWNAGAEAARAAEGAGQSSTTAAGADGASTAGWAAAAASALRSGQRVMDKNASDEQKAYDASLAIPRAVGAFYTLGGSELAEGLARKQWGGTMKKVDNFMMNNPYVIALNPTMAASRLWTSDKWKTEGNRLKGLQKAGVEIPEWAQARMFQKRGIKKQELLHPGYDNTFQGATSDGFVDNLFENSRDESKMAPETMQRYAVWAEKRPDWFQLSDQQRRAATIAARDAGALREHHGTLDINDQVFNKDAMDKAIASAPAAQQQARPQQRPSRYMLKNGELFLKKGMK
jgi:hypothetical protein